MASRRRLLQTLLALPLAGISARLSAQVGGGIEQFWKFNIRPEIFLEEVFGPDVPVAQSVSVGGAVPSLIQPLPQRMRYWRADGRTAWIFDELGKDGYQPTTCGFVVRDAAIEQAKVLIYRESRGEQVGQPSFLQQLVGARIAGESLNVSVDNISGATYSVKMMQRMARTALVLDQIAS
ncbi:FMN-binding protein [Panacagrimonas sp.]|uniref:FMN-binding protein n=1 Tax=Panacagrimonas sp. TaxID=2480088 RepID=UPI003B516C23